MSNAGLHQFSHRLQVSTRGKGLYEITEQIAQWLSGCPVRSGLLTVFIQHTSASLCVNENADPDVRADMERWFNRAIPDGADYFQHTAEGDDDMTAHVKSVVLGASVTVPIRDGRLALGTWQGIYLGEHRDQGGARTVVITLNGE